MSAAGNLMLLENNGCLISSKLARINSIIHEFPLSELVLHQNFLLVNCKDL